MFPGMYGDLITNKENRRQLLYRLEAQLIQERSSFDAHWRELGEHFAPRRTRFFEEDRNRGDKRMTKIINERGLLAVRTLRAGMMSGITSPARPWRRLTTPDPDLAEFGKVKNWLYAVNQRLTTLNRRSNFYNAAPILYGDMGLFGTGAIGCFDDLEDVYRFYHFPVGSYYLATNERGIVDTFMRKFQMTVRQLVMKFGDPRAERDGLWKNFSRTVRDAWEKGNYETSINVTHMIMPNPVFHPIAGHLDASRKRFADYYYETGTSTTTTAAAEVVDNLFLRESGYDLFPVMGPRWDVTGEDTYGTNCPGMEALPSCKELQKLMKDKAKGLRKQLDPPLTGPTSLKNQKTSLLSGDITYVDVREGNQGLRPIHETNFSYRDVREDILDVEKRISETFYEDLFLMLQRLDGVQPRNEKELADRQGEKLLALGPVLERTNDEFLDLLTDLELDKAFKRGLLPPPPEELQGTELKVEYESIMAQAQKLIGVAGTERFTAFVGNVSASFPTALDKVDVDELVGEYGDMMGVSPKIVRDAAAVAAVRQARAQQQQAAAAAQVAANTADAAKTLSEADTSTDNALTRLMAGA